MELLDIFKPKKKKSKSKRTKNRVQSSSGTVRGETTTSKKEKIQVLCTNPILFWAQDLPIKLKDNYNGETEYADNNYSIKIKNDKLDGSSLYKELHIINGKHRFSDLIKVKYLELAGFYYGDYYLKLGATLLNRGLVLTDSLNVDINSYDIYITKDKKLNVVHNFRNKIAIGTFTPENRKLLSHITNITGININSEKVRARDLRMTVPSMFLETFEVEGKVYYGLLESERVKKVQEVRNLMYKNDLIINNMLGISPKMGMFKKDYKYHLLLLLYCIILAMNDEQKQQNKGIVQMFSLLTDKFETILKIFEMTEDKTRVKPELIEKANQKILNCKDDLDELYKNLTEYVESNPEVIPLKLSEHERKLDEFLETVNL